MQTFLVFRCPSAVDTPPGRVRFPPDPYATFLSGFGDTTGVQVIVQPPTRIGAAAGSRYVPIPTVLVARHADGSEHLYAGCFVMRRSNLRPPDIPQEDVWHLYDADVREVTQADAAIPALLAEACDDPLSQG